MSYIIDRNRRCRQVLPTKSFVRGIVLALAGAMTLGFGGCAKVRNMSASFNDVTGSISKADTKVPEGELEIRNYLAKWDKRYQQHPNDKTTARYYARALRAARRADQAVAVMQKAVIQNPKDNNLLADYGKALVDAGRFKQASDVLERAQTPERPNWSISSAQGSIADQTGNHALAQEYYQQALKVAPGEPRILSNLGISYALGRDLPRAEQVLRQAAAHPRADRRVLQNLSLILALQGKFDEAEALQRQVLSASDARANIAAIRRMIAQSNTWREISEIDARSKSGKRSAARRSSRG